MALFARFRSGYVENPPQRDWPAVGPRSVGDLLRQRREELGFDLAQMGAALRIKPGYLQALEDGQPERLPGPAYAIGFLRAYSEQLGLDSEEVLRLFKAGAAGLDAKPDLSFPMPLGEGSIPGGTMLLVAVILALCGYGTWYYLSTAEHARPERVAAVPPALLPPPKPAAAPPAAADAAPPPSVGSPAPPPADAAAAAAPPAAPAAGPPVAALPLQKAAATVPAATPAERLVPGTALAPLAAPPPAAPAAAPQASLAPPAAPPPPAAAAPNAPGDAATAPPPPREPPHAYGNTGKPSRVVIIATADSWVQVRDRDGAALFSRVMKPGESYRVPDRPGLTLRTGNAGGLEITVDGKPMPPLGRSGAIRRGVELDPQALIKAAAAPQ